MVLDEILTYTPEQLKSYAAAMVYQLGISLFAALLVSFVLYIVTAIALTVIAKKLKTENPYIAWIPLASPYLEGKLHDGLKDKTLKKSKLRIHYFMMNLIYTILYCGNYIFSFFTSVNQCYEMYETGKIPISLMSSTEDPTQTAVTALIVVFGILLAFFRLKILSAFYICFEKKNGMFLVILSAIFPIITPFLYASVAKRTPVNTDFEKISLKIFK